MQKPPTSWTRWALCWAAVPLFTVGLAAAVPFAWLSGRSGRVQYGLWGGGYSLAALVLAWTTPEGEELYVQDWCLIAVALAATVHLVAAILREPRTTAATSAPDSPWAVEPGAARRVEAKRILAQLPDAARMLAIGRPDLKGVYDDGGLVDVNTVSASVLVRYLGWTEGEAARVIEARAAQGGSLRDARHLMTAASLSEVRVVPVQERLVFSP